ncbi:4-coumarate--CoA ligase 1-like [Tribolium madens]|uniref:4-coumarate--CoA ligase 1-like n=1 Tax=Tribolium madens TaxID=41895 RepID=UPI001CF72809|nr:4-coumarate--CoA ligase 1-like [Tribolium madens]
MKFYKNNVAQYIVETGEKDTFKELLKRSIRTALNMKLEGLTENDLVCLCSYNQKDICAPFIASMFLGLKVTSLDPSLSMTDTAYLLKQVKPTIIFIVPEALNLIENSIEQAEISCKIVIFGNSDTHQQFEEYLIPNSEEHDFRPVVVSPEDTAVIFFSSGTTGLPKGICQSHYALLAQAVNVINYGAITSVSLYYSSLYWISAVLFLTASVLSGTARVICQSFDPTQIWKILDKYEVSFAFLAPSQASEMLKVGRPDNVDTSSLLCVLTGGGVFPEKQSLALRDLLPGTYISQGYGQTEVAGVLTCFNMNDVKDTLRLHYKPSSCGRPIHGIWYKIVDVETERNLGPNEQGELRVKTKYAMNGYYNLDSSESFDADGWLKTGDVVYYDEDYCFYVVDRIKEMLKYKSWHIAPAMLENILNNHPSIKLSVVIGIPDEDDGDHPMAIVILNNPEDEITGEEIEAYVAERVQDRQKLRAGVKFVTSFPITPSGKIKRREIKQMILAGQI